MKKAFSILCFLILPALAMAAGSLGDMSLQNKNAVNITGGVIAGTTIGTTNTVTLANGSVLNAWLANSSLTIGSTSISLGGTSATLAGLTSVTSTSFVGALTGNASTATALATARNINGVAFDGTGNITVTAAGSTLSDTVTVAKGGTGQVTYTKGDLLAAPGGASLNKLGVGADGFVLVADAASPNGMKWASVSGSGTVTSVGWTGGIVTVATATTTPAFTIAGTSGGIPYFSSTSTWASSGLLAANSLVVGGGAGSAPSTVTTGSNVLTALGINVGSAGAVVTNGGALGTPSSGDVSGITQTTNAAEQATTSGTSIDFTGIPAGTKKITVMFVGVSTNGTSNLLIQIGDSGGVENTGYSSDSTSTFTGAVGANSTIGFILSASQAATTVVHGSVTLNLEDESDLTWVESGVVTRSVTGGVHLSAGSKATSAVLDRVRITTVNGTDAFDAGVINISYTK